jgi:single-strand DNA-binding protein
MNKIILSGNLGSNATSQNFGDNTVINFNLAVNDNYKDQNGNWIDRTIWYQCAFWSKRSTERLVKGAKILVSGLPRLSEYTDKNGQQRSQIKVIVDSLEVVHSPIQSGAQQEQQTPLPTNPSPNTTPTEEPKDDLAF